MTKTTYPAYEKLKRMANNTSMNDRIIADFEAMLWKLRWYESKVIVLQRGCVPEVGDVQKVKGNPEYDYAEYTWELIESITPEMITTNHGDYLCPEAFLKAHPIVCRGDNVVIHADEGEI